MTDLFAGIVPHGIPSEPPAQDRLLTDQHARVAAWVAERVGCCEHAWAEYTTIGLEREGELVGGAVFESFTGTNANIHVAGSGPYWMTRTFLFAVFDYAFNQLKLKRLTGYVEAANTRALDFDRKLGFKDEAVLEDAMPSGDVIILCMRAEHCRFI
jgi:RimJ/RimL family protein N-acetyltransferase